MAYLNVITYAPAESGYWATQSHDVGTTLHEATGVVGASRLTLQWTRTVPTGVTEDIATWGLWYAKPGPTPEYGRIAGTDLGTIEALVDTLITNLKTRIVGPWKNTAYIWHHYDASTPKSLDESGNIVGQKPGPAARTVVKSVLGTATGNRMPDQVGANVTFRTGSRRHWGRAYIGGLTSTGYDTTYGRLTNAFVDGIATTFDAHHTDVQAAGFELGVWSQLHPAFLTVKQVEVDDVPDIQRRRRPKRMAYRNVIG